MNNSKTIHDIKMTLLKLATDINNKIMQTCNVLDNFYNNELVIENTQLIDPWLEEVFTNRTYNLLRQYEITNLNILCSKSEKDLLLLRNFGRQTLIEITDMLACRGLRLRDDDWRSNNG